MTEIDGDPLERLKETFTSPYPLNNSEWEALLKAISTQFGDVDAARNNIQNAKYVDDATGKQLEKLASIFDIDRDSSWTTAEFRSRIKVGLRQQLSSATRDEIEEAVSVLIDEPVENVTVIETTNLEPATIQLDIPDGSFDTSILSTVAESITAVGVDVGLRVLLTPEETPVFADSKSVDVTVADQAYWDEDALWDIDHWDTVLFEFTLSPSESLVFDDGATTTFEQVTTAFWDEANWDNSIDVWA